MRTRDSILLKIHKQIENIASSDQKKKKEKKKKKKQLKNANKYN